MTIVRQNLDLKRALSKERQLDQLLSGIEAALVAFSGGVDSAFLLSKAIEVIGREHVLAVTVNSVLNQPQESAGAADLAREMQARHLVLEVDPLKDETFTSNSSERCYYCKRNIYGRLLEISADEGLEVVLDGTNADDPQDHRPGLRALEELGIRSPLLEVSLSKEEIRALAQQGGLPVWDKPAAACLASRFPYGEKITEQNLRMVAEAESYLRNLGVKQNLRVRCHGKLARIEVNRSEEKIIITRREAIVTKLQELGFAYVTIDLCGFESGSMNRLLPRSG